MSDPAVLKLIDNAMAEGAQPAVSAYDFDMLVLGSGPAGQRAAIQAAKLGKRTAVVERRAVVGGVCINTGTIPSKTLREAVLHLSGYHEKEHLRCRLYGEVGHLHAGSALPRRLRHPQ